MSEVYLVAKWSDGSVSHEAFQTEIRAPRQPRGVWTLSEDKSTWLREANDANIEYELARTSMLRSQTDKVTLMGWRTISNEEHLLFSQDRPGTGSPYRNALVDNNGKVEHDIPKARELCKSELRRLRGNALVALDAEWNIAIGAENQKAADDVEAKRKVLRDLTNDPRIASAQSVSDLKAITATGVIDASTIVIPVSPVKTG